MRNTDGLNSCIFTLRYQKVAYASMSLVSMQMEMWTCACVSQTSVATSLVAGLGFVYRFKE